MTRIIQVVREAVWSGANHPGGGFDGAWRQQ